MLVECPRCHFRQPQDQYCASCGVDMLAYKPKEEPLLTKIVKSGMFQFLMVVLLGIGVTYFVVRTDQPQQWIQRINRFASVSPNPKAVTEAGIAEDQAEFEAPPPEANTWTARAASPTDMAAAMSADGAVATGAATPPATTASASQTQLVSGTTKLLIRMVEIDHDYIDDLTADGKGLESTVISGNIKVFRTYPDTVIENTYFKTLKTDVLTLNKDQRSLSLIAGNSSRGFRLSFQALDDMRENLRFLDARFVKLHPNDNKQFPFEIFLNSNEKLIISGSDLISYFELENDLASVAPFTVFKSADYRNQKTTFAIIIELQ